MTKKRSKSQRIGSRGEKIFALFCEQNQLIPNKVQSDFGFDFLCQIDLANTPSAMGEVASCFIGFSVRSTENPSGKIKLTRADAECLLAANFPVGLALIKTDGKGTDEIFFRMLDDSLTIDLHRFLESKKRTKRFLPTDLLPGSEIFTEVKRASSCGFVENTKLSTAESITESLTGDVRIEIRRTRDGQVTLVTALNLYRYFEQTSNSEKNLLQLATFGSPEFRDQRLRNLALKKGLLGGLARLPKPYVLSGFIMDEPTSTRVTSPDISQELQLFRTGNEHHFGFVHKAGFALTISYRKEQEGQYIHDMQVLIDEDSCSAWADHLDLLEFLAACRPESRFIFDGTRKTAIDADYFTGLGRYANFATALNETRTVAAFQDIPVVIRDATLEESRLTISWLATVASMGKHGVPRGMLFQGIQEGDCLARNAAIWMPVMCNLADTSVVVWFSGTGVIYFHDESPCGYKVDAWMFHEVEMLDKQEKGSIHPEVSLGDITLKIQDGQQPTVSKKSPYSREIHLEWELADEE